jgi:hypothetical protein
VLELLAFLGGIAVWASSGCEERVAPVIDASPPPPPPPPQREGCARVGAIDAIETDPMCAIRRVDEDAMRASMKRLTVTVGIEPAEVFAGGTGLVNVTIKNTSPVETLVLFEARTRLPGPRTDWSRVLGVPEPHAATAETSKLFFPMMTTDAWDRDVDALPTIAGSAVAAPPPSMPLGVHLRPGGKLTHTLSWWALRIPAPAPIVQDDAGHRYIPKTAAIALNPGEYSIVLDLPLYGLTREERKFTARVKVMRAPKLDGGAR